MSETEERTDGGPVVPGDPSGSSPVTASPPPDGTAPPVDVVWWQRLGVHAAALLVLLLALVPLFDSLAPAFTDEGIYLAQVDNLAEGSWSSPRPALDVDPDGTFIAVTGALIDGDEAIPYARKPLYMLVLVPFYELAGQGGVLVVSALGTFVAALSAALLARRLDPRYAVPTLWVVGVGSPLLFDAYLVMGHSIAAGLSGLLLLAVTIVVDDRRVVWLPVAGVVAACLVAVRSEGMLLVAATAVVVGLASVTSLRPPRLDPLRVIAAAIVGGTGVVAYLLDGRAARAVSGGLQTRTGSVVTERDPVNAVWTGLLRPWGFDGRTAVATTVIAALCVVLAVIALKVLPRLTILPVALLVLAAGAAVVRHLERPYLVTGLLAVFPVAVAVVLLTRDDLRRPLVVRLAGVSLLTAAGIALTTYAEGGSTEWGGRFFHVTLPLLCPLVVLGMDRARRALPRSEAIVAGSAVLVLLAANSALGLRLNLLYRNTSSDVVASSDAFAAGLPDRPLVAYVSVTPAGTGRFFWQRFTDDAEQLTLSNLSQLGSLLENSEAAGRARIVVVTPLSPILLASVLAGDDDGRWSVGETDDLSGGFAVMELELDR